MTCASFVRLALRMLIAYSLLIWLPPKVSLVLPLLADPSDDVFALMMLFLLIFVLILSIWAWFCPDWFSQKLMPHGTIMTHAENYAEWQTIGLRFIGGWLLLQACIRVHQALFIDGFLNNELGLMIFDVLTGLLLLVGWNGFPKTKQNA